jgi:glycosyltransferase involved in cell wall biosynthesis
LIPFVERKKLLGYLSSCNLSVYPAFRDSGSMSVLESSVMGCPTVCFNAGGQDVFPDDILLKVQVANSYNQNLRAFSEKLYWAYCNQNMIKILGEKAKKYVYNHLTWDKRVDFFCDIYKDMLSQDKH